MDADRTYGRLSVCGLVDSHLRAAMLDSEPSTPTRIVVDFVKP
jgi:hypothetical protein